MARQPKEIEQNVVADDGDEFVLIVSQRLQAARKQAGLSQNDLAERMGVKQTYIYSIEYGSANCTIKTLYKIAKALDLDIRDLLPGGPLEPPTKRDLSLLLNKLDTLVMTVKEHVVEVQRQTAEEKRQTAIEFERRRKSDVAILKQVQLFADMHDTLSQVAATNTSKGKK